MDRYVVVEAAGNCPQSVIRFQFISMYIFDVYGIIMLYVGDFNINILLPVNLTARANDSATK